MRKRSYISTNHIVQSHLYPETFITRNKNRLKLYRGENVYLNDDDEFEIEFDNLTDLTWLAKIKLNGEWISSSGLVLRPGEHMFLDTPDLNSRNKRRFRFETYEIESGRSHLIQDNGRVEILFYKMQSTVLWWANDTMYTMSSVGTDASVPYSISSHIGERHNNYDTSNDIRHITLSSTHMSTGDYNTPKEETGRIERGSKSDQDFVDANKTFESFHYYITEYKILPISKRPKTIQEVKQYCVMCERRCKKNENFCPKCGNRH